MNVSKKKTLNRTLIRIVQALLIGSTAIFTLSAVFLPGSLFNRIFAVIMIVSVLIFFLTHRCPYCWALHAALDTSGVEAGVCRKCGRVMEFDR